MPPVAEEELYEYHIYPENSETLTLYHIYAPAYSKNSGRALSVTPVRPVRTYVRTSFPIRVRAITPKLYGIY